MLRDADPSSLLATGVSVPAPPCGLAAPMHAEETVKNALFRAYGIIEELYGVLQDTNAQCAQASVDADLRILEAAYDRCELVYHDYMDTALFGSGLVHRQGEEASSAQESVQAADAETHDPLVEAEVEALFEPAQVAAIHGAVDSVSSNSQYGPSSDDEHRWIYMISTKLPYPSPTRAACATLGMMTLGQTSRVRSKHFLKEQSAGRR